MKGHQENHPYFVTIWGRSPGVTYGSGQDGARVCVSIIYVPFESEKVHVACPEVNQNLAWESMSHVIGLQLIFIDSRATAPGHSSVF